MDSILEKIKEKGVTINQVAKMVGVNRSTLSRIISDKQSYTSEKTKTAIHAYLDALNTNDENILNKIITKT